MCGLAGILAPAARDADLRAWAEAMTSALRHRGPDAAGVWAPSGEGAAIAHTRLSIIDLSDHGNQPMISENGRFVLAYNGEIYNHEELRQLLGPSVRFAGTSDTEVLLKAIGEWGTERTLCRVNGMFAFALWDRHDKYLTLARDRLGEKPLYYGWHSGMFVFASELKALSSLPAWPPPISQQALDGFLRYGCVPSPLCIFRGLHQLSPGSMIRVSRKRAGTDSGFTATADAPRGWGPRRYWSAATAAEAGAAERLDLPPDELATATEKLLQDAVKIRLRADVPLGAFLSGGVDSSTVVALMQKESARPVRTFTIGFSESAYNEAPFARLIAKRLGTDHTEMIVKPSDARDVIPRIATIYDEPFADSSQIPMLLVAQLARRDVTVALSGDGGDEAFGGYTRHVWGERIWPQVSRLPRPARRALASVLSAVSPAVWDKFGPLLAGISGPFGGQGRFGDKMHKVAEVFNMSRYEELYERLVSSWPSAPLRRDRVGDPPRWTDVRPSSHATVAEGLMLFDQTGYLPDDILVKVDRAAMACSLEGRMPFLDHRVVEWAWRLPVASKVTRAGGKRLLRSILHRHLPAELVDRPKMGFGLPIGEWLRGPLRPWAEDLLSERRLRDEGYFNVATVRQRWHDHLSGRHAGQAPIWTILMFQTWLDAQGNKVHA